MENASGNPGTAEPAGESVSARHAREARAAWWGGLTASLLLHVLLLLLWRGGAPLPSDGARAGRQASPESGGGGMRAVNARLPEAREVPPPPEPVLAIDVPEVQITTVAASISGPELRPIPAGPLPGLGGAGNGEGEGDGGTGDGGDDYVSPMPRSVLPHWDPPGSVRGMEVTVRVRVDERGRPTGEVVLDPPTPHRGFNREIEERVRRMEYRPAMRGGRPVPGWAEITFIF